MGSWALVAVEIDLRTALLRRAWRSRLAFEKMKRIYVGAFHRDEVLCSLSTNDAVA